MFRLMERDQHWSDRDGCAWLEFLCACFVDDLPTSFPVALLHLWFCWFGLVKNEILQTPNPKDRELESHPYVVQHPEKLSPLLWSCAKPKSVSCTSNLLARTCDFRKSTELLLMLISSLRDLLQNQSPGTILIGFAVLCFTHNNIVGIHMYDECTRSNAPNVCHMLLSIL